MNLMGHEFLNHAVRSCFIDYLPVFGQRDIYCITVIQPNSKIKNAVQRVSKIYTKGINFSDGFIFGGTGVII